MAVSGFRLPPVVNEGLVCLRHLVRVVPFLDRGSLLPIGLHQLRRQPFRHRPPRARASCPQEPAHGERHLPRRPHLERYLVGRAAYATRPHLEHRHDVAHRLLEHLARVFLRALGDVIESAVDYAFSHALLPILHYLVNHRLHPDAVVLSVRRRSMTDNLTASGHRKLPGTLTRPFGPARPVLAALLVAALDADGVKSASHDVITHAGQVTHPPAADEDDGGLLEGVTLTGDVGSDLDPVRQADAGDLTQRGVRLLWRLRPHVGADPALLRVAFAPHHAVLERIEAETQRRRLRLASEGLASLSHQFILNFHFRSVLLRVIENKKPKVASTEKLGPGLPTP